MGRPPRAVEGGLIYHALNRGNGRLRIFDEPADYHAFLRVLDEAVARHRMRLLAYCVMPNHFHLLLWPRDDGDLSRFMSWLTLTHTQRWHAHRQSVGSGHLYQGRFKSFPIEGDEHFLVACRYVERNALRAGLVDRAEAWRWGSLAQRPGVKPADPAPPLTPWPIDRPADWLKRVNESLTPTQEEAFQRGIRRGQPFGSRHWQEDVTRRLGLESTFRPRGRPKKPINGS
jgi:putative transposase